MYNSYYTVKPCQNKFLQSRLDDKARAIHKKALENMKPVVDTKAPKTFQLIRKE
ncbi:hypothetical protein CLF_111135, partial [Clonorchis sinensis]